MIPALEWIAQVVLLPLFMRWLDRIQGDPQKQELFENLKEQYASPDKATRSAARRALSRL